MNMVETEAAVCLLVLVFALWKAGQRIHDEELEAQRRLRRKLMLAAQRKRAVRRRGSRLQREHKRQQYMQMMHHYYFDIMQTSKVWAYPRTSDWWEITAQRFTDDQWLEDFRVSRETFKSICTTVKPALERRDTAFRLCIPLEKRVAIALYKLASTSEYRTVGNLFAVSQTSVCRCVHEFCKAVITLLRPKLIQTPNQAKLAEMADYFEERFGIPQCVGAIGGSHIPILKPPQYQSDLHNRKGWHSIILQAVVDGKGMFWDLNIGQSGREHNVGDLRNSRLWAWATTSNAFSGRVRNICGTNVGYFILGDSAYPLQNWLLKPYPDTGRLTEGQEQYNIRTSRARCVVVRAFGKLKGRWKCLSKRNDCSVNVVVDMVETCCTLHNLCELHMERFVPEWGDGEDTVRPPCNIDNERSDVRSALQQLFMQQQ
ncbi:uncharacterized protein gpr132a isoform X1 [Myxocyprinus asiaticus]|uniref:uncharacterized protein gpr132a isoform X1 n=2 Tax=Myxocyprinus asiaticus TaxID=70543 RepID=UPI0022228CC7|nr:uncharacterized protein gpr132a isoform X1 [Myxocyprinus asiaticus]